MIRVNAKGLAAIAAAGLVAASPFLVDHLGRWEGEGQNVVYADKLANGIPTVCEGITRWVTDTPIIVGETWSDAKCAAEKERALVAVQTHLILCFDLKQKIPQSVFDMATSHAWNVGHPNTCGSAAMRAWRTGNWELGCKRMAVSDSGKLVWSYANGVFVRGLANRRADEWKKCVP